MLEPLYAKTPALHMLWMHTLVCTQSCMHKPLSANPCSHTLVHTLLFTLSCSHAVQGTVHATRMPQEGGCVIQHRLYTWRGILGGVYIGVYMEGHTWRGIHGGVYMEGSEPYVRMHLRSASTQHVYAAHLRSAFTQRIYAARFRGAFTQRTYAAHLRGVVTRRVYAAHLRSAFARRVYAAHLRSASTQRIYAAHLRSASTQRINAAWLHGTFTRRVCAVRLRSASTQRIYAAHLRSAFTQRICAACLRSAFAQRVYAARLRSAFAQHRLSFKQGLFHDTYGQIRGVDTALSNPITLHATYDCVLQDFTAKCSVHLLGTDQFCDVRNFDDCLLQSFDCQMFHEYARH